MKNLLNLIFMLLVISNISIWSNYYNLKKSSGILEIYVLDVGQGDSILVKTPDNKFGLIDGGRGDSVINELSEVMPSNIREIEFVIFTHMDADHSEGLIKVLERYSVKNVFIQPISEDNEIYTKVKNTIKDKSITNYTINDLNDFVINNVNFNIIWPKSENELSKKLDDNDMSVGTIINYYDFSFFSAGDLSNTYELEALELQNFTDVDVLKAGHHGSKTSTNNEFLDLADPKVTLISVGFNNSYGHPSFETIDLLNSYNIDIYRTDKDGRIMLQVNKDDFTVNTQNSSKKYYN